MKKTLIKIAVILTLAALLIPVFASCGKTASASDANGGWGDISWEYTKSNKTLTIRGSETMPNAADETAVGWTTVRESVEKVVITTELKNIGDYAFYGMTNLKTISIPNSVTAIGKYSFAYCSSLEKIVLPEGAVSIGNSAFEMCASLKAITLPTKLTSLGSRSFALCTSLEKVTFAGNGISYNAENAKVVMPIGELTFFKCAKLASVTVPLDFESTFAENAFKDAKIKAEDVKKVDPTAEEETAAPTEKPTDAVTEKPTEAPTGSATEAPTQPVVEEPESKLGSIIAVVVLGVALVGICVVAILLIRSNKKQTAKGNTVRKNDKNSKKK